MSAGPGRRPVLVLVGGGRGLVGRSVVAEFRATHEIRSVHRTPSESERSAGVAWTAADLASFDTWGPLLDGADLVLNVAWYRIGNRRRFEALFGGLHRLLEASVRAKVPRFVQVSVPNAPAHLERSFPYLVYKRRFDAELAASGLSYRIVRPTMLFGPGDVLLGVMLRTLRRYGRLPLFGTGATHVTPLAVADLARILRREADSGRQGTLDVGGPRRYTYRELCELLFRAAGRPPRFWRMSERNGVRLARILEALGSRLLYAYEVEWLLSDLLALPPYEGLPGGLVTVESYLGLSPTD